jgi:hypothetical protein
METQNMKTLGNKILKANAAQLDASWAILKYKEIGILRKLDCYSELFNLKSDKVFSEAPATEDGRILDKPTRNVVHEYLIQRSSEINGQ